MPDEREDIIKQALALVQLGVEIPDSLMLKLKELGIEYLFIE